MWIIGYYPEKMKLIGIFSNIHTLLPMINALPSKSICEIVDELSLFMIWRFPKVAANNLRLSNTIGIWEIFQFLSLGARSFLNPIGSIISHLHLVNNYIFPYVMNFYKNYFECIQISNINIYITTKELSIALVYLHMPLL